MRHYLYLIGILTPFLLNAQETNKNGFYNEPVEFSEYVKQDFINSFYFEGEPLSKLNFNSERTWIVYSDRANNPVYDRINGSRKVDVINFMDPLYVKQIQGSWLHVYSKRKKDLGWIHVEYLVICRYAILNTGSAAPRKGMALLSLNEDVDPNDLQKKIQYNYYSDPNLNSGAYKGKSNKFKIHFVLKETASAKLLSETDKLNENDQQTKSSVRGWMSTLEITNWDTRICLEPSTSRTAVAQYSSKIIPVFPKESQLKEMYNRPDPAQNAIMKNIVSSELLSPYTMRMPILEHLSSKNKKVATVGKLDYQIPDTDTDFNCLEEIQQLEKKLKNINIVFIIDGTQSMSEFYKPVVSSISAIIDNPIDVDANIQFGAIIYRDYPDNTDAYKVYSLTSNYDRIKSKLSNTVTMSSDNDRPEAQYNAIINGIPEVGFKKGESNIVVLIGDCGNHDPDLKNQSIDDAIEVLKPFDVNFISFQVIQGPDFSYVTFNLDSKTYIESILADRKTEVTKSIGELERISGSNTFQYVIDKDISITNLYGFGRFTFANMNQPMSTLELKRNIKDAIGSNIEAIKVNLINLRATCGDGSGVTVDGQDAVGGSYEEELLRYLAREYSERTGKSYEKSLELYRNANLGEMSFIGYTSTEFYNSTVDCYDKVVYLSQTEFDDLVNIFDRLLKSSGSNSTKRAFKSALSIQVKTVLGSDISQSYIDNLTLEEVWYAILTLPFDEGSRYGEIGTTRLKDLVNTTDPSFNMFYNDYINKIKGFGPAKYQERSFIMGGTRHYWVPLNDFPGNG